MLHFANNRPTWRAGAVTPPVVFVTSGVCNRVVTSGPRRRLARASQTDLTTLETGE